jgi:hypothetical protein
MLQGLTDNVTEVAEPRIAGRVMLLMLLPPPLPADWLGNLGSGACPRSNFLRVAAVLLGPRQPSFSGPTSIGKCTQTCL